MKRKGNALMLDAYKVSGTSPTTDNCPVCQGRGEVAIAGTYGPTISPEALELRQCWNCDGEGIVSTAAALLEEARWAARSGPCVVLRPASEPMDDLSAARLRRSVRQARETSERFAEVTA